MMKTRFTSISLHATSLMRHTKVASPSAHKGRLVLTLLLMLTTTMSRANIEVLIDDIKYSLNSSDYTAGVIQKGGEEFYSGDITIPLTVMYDNVDYDVNSIIGSAFAGCTNLTSVTIPVSVKTIGNNAFADCTNLATVTIPVNVTSIGKDAFAGCTNLATVTVYALSCTLGTDAFKDCNKLSHIYVFSGRETYYKDEDNWCDFENIIEPLPYPHGYCGATGKETDVRYVLTGTAPNYTITIFGDGNMEDYYYKYDETITRPWNNYIDDILSVIVEDGMGYIGEEAFINCPNLKSVTIGEVNEIGQSAFENCQNLETVTFVNSGLRIIGSSAFSDCRKLTVITIPKTVEEIGTSAFTHCSNLTSVIFEDDSELEEIEDDVFEYCSSLQTITLPDDLDEIGDEAFKNCSSLQTITIPQNIKEIPDACFEDCTNLRTVIFADGSQLEKIVGWGFEDCENLKSINLPVGLKEIGNASFTGCSSLTSITIPNNVEKIGPKAFNGCTSLGSVYVHRYDPSSDKPLTTLDCTDVYDEVFNGCTSLANIYVPAAALDGYKTADYWSDYQSKIKGLNYCAANSNVVWEYDNTTKALTISGMGDLADWNADPTPWYAFNEEITDVIIDNGVTSIGKDAFAGCTGLKTVIVGSGVASIRDNAFQECTALTSVTIPASVTNISDYVFYGCTGLETVTIGSGITYIGNNAFYGCTSVTDVYCYGNPYMDWDELMCNDFITSPNGATVCHVFGDASTWSSRFGTTVNVTFKGDLAPTAATNSAEGAYWGTYYNSAADLKADDNTTVYKGVVNGSVITLTEIADKVINSGQAVILRRNTAGAVTLTLQDAASTADYTDNNLHGVDVAAPLTALGANTDTYYVLGNKNSHFGFHKYTGTNMPANKAYLRISGGGNALAPCIDLYIDEVTGIKTPQTSNVKLQKEDDAWYTLSGTRLNGKPTTKGLYIHNGLKVVIK